MMARCYKKHHDSYKYYGAKGVSVCEQWQTLNGFIDTIDLVDGWNEEKFINGELSLDKDSVNIDNKLYSPETCRFVSMAINNNYRPTVNKVFIGTNKYGEVFESHNQSDFAKEHNLRQSTISDCLKGRVKVHRGWTFRYKDK